MEAITPILTGCLGSRGDGRGKPRPADEARASMTEAYSGRETGTTVPRLRCENSVTLGESFVAAAQRVRRRTRTAPSGCLLSQASNRPRPLDM